MVLSPTVAVVLFLVLVVVLFLYPRGGTTWLHAWLRAQAFRERRCPFCAGSLKHMSGYERSGPEYAGASREVDDFQCQRCQRKFRHIVKDNFSTFYEWWGLKDGSDWVDMSEDQTR